MGYKNNKKSIKYIRINSYTDYDSRWIKGNIEKYLDFMLKKPKERVYNEKKALIKYYQVEYEDN